MFSKAYHGSLAIAQRFKARKHFARKSSASAIYVGDSIG